MSTLHYAIRTPEQARQFMDALLQSGYSTNHSVEWKNGDTVLARCTYVLTQTESSSDARLAAPHVMFDWDDGDPDAVGIKNTVADICRAIGMHEMPFPARAA